MNKPSRIATLLKIFQQTPPRGVADNEQVGGALSRLAQNIRPQDPNNMLEEFANLPGHALANTIDAGAALIQPDQLVKAAQQVYRDPQPAIQGLKDFGAEVAERPVALMEQLGISDFIAPGAAGIMTAPLKRSIFKTISDPKILAIIKGIPVGADVTPPKKYLNPLPVTSTKPEDAAIVKMLRDEGLPSRRVPPPEKSVKSFKLFRTNPSNPGKIFPLFVDSKTEVSLGEWVSAGIGPMSKSGKVKSKIGDLAFRPGWHSGDSPSATHIGGKSTSELKSPDYRPANQVWAEVEMGDDVNWQAEALSRADITKGGKINSKSAAIVDQIPHGGHYRFKTNPNMAGTWLIGGELKVNRIIDNPELLEISQSLGSSDLPSLPKLIQEKGLSLKELNAESIRELKVYYPEFFAEMQGM